MFVQNQKTVDALAVSNEISLKSSVFQLYCCATNYIAIQYNWNHPFPRLSSSNRNELEKRLVLRACPTLFAVPPQGLRPRVENHCRLKDRCFWYTYWSRKQWLNWRLWSQNIRISAESSLNLQRRRIKFTKKCKKTKTVSSWKQFFCLCPMQHLNRSFKFIPSKAAIANSKNASRKISRMKNAFANIIW